MSNYFYKDLYKILEIEPTDDTAKIKSAFRKLARKYHPDLNGGNSVYEEKFKEISEACEILMDKDKKSLYDTFKGYSTAKRTINPDKQKAQRAYKSAQTSSKSHVKHEKKTDANHTKGSFSDVLNDILEGLFQENKSGQARAKSQGKVFRKPQNGSDITAEVEITYLEALTGTNRTVNVLHTEVCPNCSGRIFINGSTCPLCKGSGETSIHKKINVKIPKNIKQNAKIRIAGEGNRGRYGGRNGDVYLLVKIQNDEKYTYDGLNVGFSVVIYPHEAVFGTDVSVETPQGAVSMKIPANTSQGQKFRLSSHGLKDDDGKVGDAIVTVKIDLPQELTDEELELYKKLSEISPQRRKEGKV